MAPPDAAPLSPPTKALRPSRWRLRPSAMTMLWRLVLTGLVAILIFSVYLVLSGRFLQDAVLLDTSRSQIALYRNFRNPTFGFHRRLSSDYHMGKVSIHPPGAAWTDFAAKLHPPLDHSLASKFADFPLAFAGTLTAKGGKPRLVIIRLEIANTGDGSYSPSPEFWARTIVVDTSNAKSPRVVRYATTVLGPLQYSQVHCGKIDPAKPDRCTILIESGRLLGETAVASSLNVEFILGPDDTVRTEPSGIPWKL